MTDLLDRPSEKPGISIEPETFSQKPILAERYEVIHKLVGGMGLVYLCLDIPTNELVALKTFKPEYLSHRMARDLFLREGTMWVELGSHPNIVRANRVERIGDGREVYLVLEWIVQPEGKNSPALRSWMRRGRPLPLKQALLFTLHIIRGMKYATSKIAGLVHRDLKPENVLIGHDGVARVTDFGLAGTLTGMGADLVTFPPGREHSTRTQVTRGVVGTPLYMAPEQWQHQPLDARTDMYALGCILYEMVSGRFAADGETRQEIQDIHLSGAIKPPPSLLPKEVIRFLLNCLMVNPDQRFRDWRTMEKALVEVYKHVISKDVPTERVAGDITSEDRIALGESYNSMGLSYLDIGKLDVAVMYFEQAVIIARNEKSLKLECAGLGNLGQVYRAMGYGKRAVEFHEEQLTIAHETGNRAEQGHALGELGQAYRSLKDPRRAVRFHEQQLAIAKELADRYKEAAALDSMALSYHQLGQVDKAVDLNKQTLAVATDIGDQVRIKSVLSHMGRIYLDGGNTQEALALFKQSLEQSRQLGDRIGEGESFSDLGDLYLSMAQTDRAIELYKLALKIARESNNGIREVHNLGRLGDLHFQSNELSLAETYYREALAVAKQISTQASEMELLGKLGDVYMVIGDSMQAASFYKRQLSISRDLGDRDAGKKALVGIGESYELWGDPTRAIDYFEKYLEISRKQKDWLGVADMLYVLGERYRKIKQLVPAYHSFEEYVSLMDRAGNQEAVVDGLNQMGNVSRDGHNVKNAIDLYKKALDIAQDNNDLVGESWTHGNLSIAYEQMGKQWQASRSGDKSVRLAQKSRKKKALARAHYHVALIAYRQGKWDKVLESAQIAQVLYASIGDEPMQEKSQRLVDVVKKRNRKTGFFS
ncbi:MAG: hypothetical protein CSA11_10490 [Chloroflexi bacterium]|nr:MAG: hypothetical protein CSB13_07320 [Chloroflexota bacterium]PIE79886.1 MAG: hypothetical protein CSA11_10490 [Chloroflexota bacterium]